MKRFIETCRTNSMQAAGRDGGSLLLRESSNGMPWLTRKAHHAFWQHEVYDLTVESFCYS
jgi:hypothetical protein